MKIIVTDILWDDKDENETFKLILPNTVELDVSKKKNINTQIKRELKKFYKTDVESFKVNYV